MFTIIGVLSVVFGASFFGDALAYSSLSIIEIFQQGPTIIGSAMSISCGMVVAGILGIFSKGGSRKKLILTGSVFYLLPAVFSILMGYDGLALWSAICIILGSLSILWVALQTKNTIPGNHKHKQYNV
ncbi:MAG: hypothetical protein K6F61_10695 [Clostridiales bacterium]|nr:hypothetical protein [Clostridiales bacterium]